MPANDLRIREEMLQTGGVILFHLDGQLDTHSFEELNNAIQARFDEDHFKMIFDMAGVDYISSTCVAVFLSALATAVQNGGLLVLLSPAPKVKMVFDLFGLQDELKICNDMKSAIGLFQ